MPTSSRRNLRFRLPIFSTIILLFALQSVLPAAFAQGTAPSLSGISPSSAAVGSAGFTLTVFGSNFLPTSTVQWNGSSRTTTYQSSAQLTAQITQQDIQLLGNNKVAVFNPGGVVSSPMAFTVFLALATNDLIYDSHRSVLWASVPSSAGAKLGNSVVSIDPYTGVLGTHIWVGSEPGKLSLSTDGTVLWVAMKGTPSVRKVRLDTMALNPVKIYFPGGWGSNTYATDLAASPGSTSTVAIAAGFVSIYDNAVARPQTGNSGATHLAFGASPSNLYGYTNGLSIFTVDNTGISSTQTPPNSGSYSNDLRYDNNRLYLTSGQVLDGTTGNLLGSFAASGPVAPDSKVGQAFVLNSSQQYGNTDQVTAFSQKTFVPLGSFGIGALQTGFNGPSSFVRWGGERPRISH